MLSRVLKSEMRQNPTNLGRKAAIIIQVLTKQVSGEDAGSADHIKTSAFDASSPVNGNLNIAGCEWRLRIFVIARLTIFVGSSILIILYSPHFKQLAQLKVEAKICHIYFLDFVLHNARHTASLHARRNSMAPFWCGLCQFF